MFKQEYNTIAIYVERTVQQKQYQDHDCTDRGLPSCHGDSGTSSITLLPLWSSPADASL